MVTTLRSIPKPLVTTNQFVIVISVLLAWFTNIEWILTFPLISGLLGLLFNFNPVMRIAMKFLRNAPASYIQEDWEQQQFNQKIAVVCLSVGLVSFSFNYFLLGYVFTAMVALSAFIAIFGFCIGCFIRFQWKRWIYNRNTKKTVDSL